MAPSTYDKLLTENITKAYQLAQAKTERSTISIVCELKEIADDLNITNQVEKMTQTQACISIKDRKDDFENNTKSRLINPAKNDLGKVCKSILDRINNEIREQTIANQWSNSNDTIAFFNSINDKNRHTFLSQDILDFYPSISEKLID